jgi:hypothetical protein
MTRKTPQFWNCIIFLVWLNNPIALPILHIRYGTSGWLAEIAIWLGLGYALLRWRLHRMRLSDGAAQAGPRSIN